MRFSVAFAAVLAASVEASGRQRRQWGYPDVEDCGLDGFEGHTSEAALFCSNILRSGTATATVTNGYTTTTTTTKKTTVTIQPTTTPTPTPTPTPEPTPTPTPTSKSTSKSTSSSPPSPPSSSSSPKPSSSATPVQPSSTVVSSTLVSSPSPTPTAAPSCGIVAYVKTTPAYYFESSGTKNTFDACSALCKADSKCKSFGYGEANCMLFDVTAAENTNYNPMSPYTFYDAACPAELPVRKRQLDISLGLPGGIHISLGLGPGEISSACSCFITKGPASTTVTRTVSSAVVRTSTVTSTVTRTRGVGAE
ncbi:hypothetical protein AG0111_0g4452 [Alternaria gaisen]|uniref:Uncharacterized protein n=1 Tax=Alternaria gaisen TaxID=167740 RepID=A0ACB6FU67_9PLEO|nr:hypothetical protein AG0111_0g4452 [Alternaria gaisen]